MSPDPMAPCAVTLTGPDHEWMRSFVRRLVEDRLAAAGHVDTMDTRYRWQSEVHEAVEARAIVHTTFARVADIADRVRQEHPYEVANVSATPILDGEPRYLAWIVESSSRD